MAKWEFERERAGNVMRVKLVRDGIKVGVAKAFIMERFLGRQNVDIPRILAEEKYRQEYAKAHKGIEIDEALGMELLKTLNKEGFSYILPNPFPSAKKIFEKFLSSGIIKKTTTSEFMINWYKLPDSEEAAVELMRKGRAGILAAGAERLAKQRVAKMEKFRKKVKRFRPRAR